MSITDTPHDNIVLFHAAIAGAQTKRGIATDANMQALAEGAVGPEHLRRRPY